MPYSDNLSKLLGLEDVKVKNVREEVAEELLSEWIYNAETSSLPEFYDCTRAVHNWGKLILNSFDCRYTNGFTEGYNNKTKELKRVCYGMRKCKGIPAALPVDGISNRKSQKAFDESRSEFEREEEERQRKRP